MQMSEKYEQVIRRHMDLETVREQLLRDQQGAWAYITIHMYRDLLLICNNAIAFYPKGSREYSAALHLRHLCAPCHHTSMPTLLACGRQREAALEPVTVKVKMKEKDKNKKVARKTRTKKGKCSSSDLTVVKKNKVRSSPPVKSEVEKKNKKSGKQSVKQTKRGATALKQHIQPVKKRIASSALASTPPQKRARKAHEIKRTTASAKPPPAAAKKPRPRIR